MIEALEDFGISTLTEMINEIYDSGTIPEDLSKSIFIALPKKRNAIECELHRTISLMSHLIKIVLRTLMWRERKSIRPEIGKEQYGFMKGTGTRNAIFTLRMICERSMEMQKDLYIYICFIDCAKAFESVIMNNCWKYCRFRYRRKRYTFIKNFLLGTNSRLED